MLNKKINLYYYIRLLENNSLYFHTKYGSFQITQN